jgi:hypothetical protein
LEDKISLHKKKNSMSKLINLKSKK